jgi:hypothetical protein
MAFPTLRQVPSFSRFGASHTVSCMQIAPSRASFVEKVGLVTEDKYAELKAFLDAFKKVIADVDTFLKQHDLDDPTAV